MMDGKSNEPVYLFTVTDRLMISDLGLLLLPGIPWKGALAIRRGDPLILRTPLGEVIETELLDLEMINHRPGGKMSETTAIRVSKKLHKFDVPLGTEVFLKGFPPVESD